MALLFVNDFVFGLVSADWRHVIICQSRQSRLNCQVALFARYGRKCCLHLFEPPDDAHYKLNDRGLIHLLEY